MREIIHPTKNKHTHSYKNGADTMGPTFPVVPPPPCTVRMHNGGHCECVYLVSVLCWIKSSLKESFLFLLLFFVFSFWPLLNSLKACFPFFFFCPLLITSEPRPETITFFNKICWSNHIIKRVYSFHLIPKRALKLKVKKPWFKMSSQKVKHVHACQVMSASVWPYGR